MDKYTEFEDYISSLHDMHLSAPDWPKYKELMEAAERVCPEKILDMFIPEIIDRQGKGMMPHSWFHLFSERFMIVPKRHSSDHKLIINIYPLKDRLFNVVVTFRPDNLLSIIETGFNPLANRDVYYLRINCSTDTTDFELTAIAEHCEKLFRIYDTYIKPNIPLSPCLLLNQHIKKRDESSGADEVASSAYARMGRLPNDDRSDSFNPNNPAHQASRDNRSNQLNPNSPAYHSSRGGGKGR